MQKYILTLLLIAGLLLVAGSAADCGCGTIGTTDTGTTTIIACDCANSTGNSGNTPCPCGACGCPDTTGAGTPCTCLDGACGCPGATIGSLDTPCDCPCDDSTNLPCTCIPAGCTCLDNVSGTMNAICGCPDSPDSPCDCPGIPATGTSCDCSPAGDEAPITSPEIVCDSAPAGGNCTFGTYNSTNRTYENHTVYFRNNCSQSVWIAANMGPNGPPFVLNNATQGRGCTGCSCAGPTDAGWENGGCCCPAISCTHQSCPNSTCSLGTALPNGGGFEVPPGLPVNYTVRADSEYGGNAALFPRYGCILSPDGTYLDCDTGTCFVQGTPGTPPRGIVQCGGVPPNGPPDGSPQLPTTKMEIFFAPTGWQQTDSDFYDVSLADGYNIPVRIEPVPGTFWTGGTAHNWCIPAGGTADLLGKIREPQYHNLSMKMLILKSNRPIAIWSSCSYETQVNKTGPGQSNATTTPGQGEGIWNLSCCKGNHATEATCPIGNLPADHQTSQFFGAFFNHTYTYPYGDDQANIPCKGEKATGQLTSYLITFCGGRILATANTSFVNVTAGVPAPVSEPGEDVTLAITSSVNRENARVTVLTFDPTHLPQTFSHPITPVGGYVELSSTIPDAEVTKIVVTARYQHTDPGPDENTLRLFTYRENWTRLANGTVIENGTWVLLSAGSVDTVNRTVRGETGRFGVFAISTIQPPEVQNISYTHPDPADPLTVRFRADVDPAAPLAYAWDVDTDGTVEYTVEEPVHTYPVPGRYLVTLTICDAHGCGSSSREIFLEVPPVAGFSATPVSGTDPLTVAFNDTSTGTITAYAWDFQDDGTVDSTDQNPAYTYPAGTYTVNLTVTGPGGTDSEEKIGFITVSPRPIVADFSATPRSGAAPLIVRFTDLAAGTITSRQWDFQDDGRVDSISRNPSFIYRDPGVYPVRYTVSGPDGSDEIVREGYITVTATARPPVARFSQDTRFGPAPLTVRFTDRSQGDPTGYLWTFGDGATSPEINPVHTYTSPGLYRVSLTVTSDGGSSTSRGFVVVRRLWGPF